MPVNDLKWAIAQFNGEGTSQRRRNYSIFYNYYEGNHPLAFATAKFRSTFGALFKDFSDNLCPAVVDSLADRLKITGWSSSERTSSEQVTPSDEPGIPDRIWLKIDDPIADQCNELWEDNKMVSRAAEVHREALKEGDSYLLVWPGDDMEAEFWPQTALEMAIEYDPNKLGVIARATKIWWLPLEKRWRLNVYLPDKIEKYISRQQSPNGIPNNHTQWDPTIGDDGKGAVVPNPYGRVPVFHFANKSVYRPGQSELKDVISIQDALNKAVMDMMIAMEFASFKQRYVIGMEVEVDEETGEPTDQNTKNYGVDRLFAIPGDKNEVAVGQFDSTDLGQFRQVQNDFRAEVARVSGTPLHYFLIATGDFPSGEAIKSAEGRFVGKLEDRQGDWGPIWGEAMKFGLAIEEVLPDELELEPVWKDASPRSLAELADTAVKKKALGVGRYWLLKDLGYEDDEIQMMLQEADSLAQAQAVLQAIAKGPDVGAAPGTTPNAAGGGTEASKQAARDAAAAGRRSGPQ